MDLPKAVPNPCRECPWRRNHPPGWLGPLTAEEWLQTAHSDAPIACHLTIYNRDESLDEEDKFYGAAQCAGAAQFRRNVFKEPRDPNVSVAEDRDDSQVFGSNQEFLDHHLGRRKGD